MNIDMKSVEQAVAIEMARLAQEELDVTEMLRKAVDKRINEVFTECAERQIADAVNSAIREGFDHEYCRVNTFGQKASHPTTIRKELDRMIAEYWNAKVDKNGKPSDGYGEKMTRAEWTMAQMVASDFKGEMQQHVANVAGGLKDGLRKTLHSTVNELLSGVFRVRSADDKTAEIF
jgi:hypothetical protein